MKWLVALLLPAFLLSGSFTASATPAPQTKAVPTYLVLIVLDGARPGYFHVTNTPHVQALVHSGTHYTRAVAGILESETPSGHATLSTGSEPRKNGILSFSWASSDNIRVNLFNPDKIRAGAMERIMKSSGVPTLAQRIHEHSPQAQVVALSGSKYYAADAVGGPSANVIMYFRGTSTGQFAPTYIPAHAPPDGILTLPGLISPTMHMQLGMQDRLTMNLAIDTFQRMHQQVTLINLPEFDWPLGHVDGANAAPNAVRSLMRSFDRDLAALENAYRAAGVLDHTLFVLTADHGFTPLLHKVDPAVLESAITKTGAGVVSQSFTSGAYFWLNNGALASQAGANIVSLKNPYIQSVYVKTHTAKGYVYTRVRGGQPLRAPGAEAANQYLLGTFAGPNGPNVAVFFTESVGSEPGGQASWKGDHGGASWQVQHIPLVLSGPGVRAGAVSHYPARLMDIAPTILQLMGASPKGMQGIPLADAMASPPSWAVRWQQGTKKYLDPLVTAIHAESRLELKAGR